MHFDTLYVALDNIRHSNLRKVPERAHMLPKLNFKWAGEEQMISGLKNCFIAHDACVIIHKNVLPLQEGSGI
jgi:hypothetical protein